MKLRNIVLAAVFLLLVVPIVYAQATGREPRQLEGVELAETRFRDITFHNSAQDLQLAGMIFVPEGDGPFPATVIIHGSGTSHRANRWYLTLVQSLQAGGVAVLLPDKRGSEQSEGDWRTASFQDLATDTLAAVSYLKEQQEVDISRIGLIGMSQGGHFVPLVANQSPDVSFVVDVVGSAVTLHEQLLYEENLNLRQIGLLPGLSNLIAHPSAWSIRELRQKEFWSAVGNFDPLPHWRELSVEALVLYGEIDSNVPSAESAARLRSLNKPNIEVRIYEGSGHALEDPVGQGNRLFRQDALRDIGDFIVSR